MIFQLRNLSALDENEAMQLSVKSGQAKLVKGDALVEDDVRTAWTEANADGIPVDTVLLSVGMSSILTLFRDYFASNMLFSHPL